MDKEKKPEEAKFAPEEIDEDEEQAAIERLREFMKPVRRRFSGRRIWHPQVERGA